MQLEGTAGIGNDLHGFLRRIGSQPAILAKADDNTWQEAVPKRYLTAWPLAGRESACRPTRSLPESFRGQQVAQPVRSALASRLSTCRPLCCNIAVHTRASNLPSRRRLRAPALTLDQDESHGFQSP